MFKASKPFQLAYVVQTDGFKTIVTLTGAGVSFYEKEVTPPSIDGGGENDTTTMRNTAWRTRQPKKLKTLDKATLKVSYDPVFYSTTVAQVNVNQSIVITFPDTHTLTFWGWLNKFAPDANKEGEQPTAEVEIICSNQDNSGVEQAPVYA